MKTAKKVARRRARHFATGICGELFWKRASHWRARAAPTPSCSAKRHDGPELPPMLPYRHFSSHSDLLQAVRAAALSSLALAIEAEIAGLPQKQTSRGIGAGDAARSRHRVPEVCARGDRVSSEPQVPSLIWSRTMSMPQRRARAASIHFNCSRGALDLMAEAGVLPRERRPGAEYLAWSAVHGLAFLIIEGPSEPLVPKGNSCQYSDRLLQMVEKGLYGVFFAPGRRLKSL